MDTQQIDRKTAFEAKDPRREEYNKRLEDIMKKHGGSVVPNEDSKRTIIDVIHEARLQQPRVNRKITIIHASRGRPKQAAKTAKKWLSSARDVSRIEYILSLDDDDIHPYEAVFIGIDVNSLYNDNHTAIEAINAAAKIATGDLLIVVSDDFDCPFHWDAGLLQMLDGREDFVVKTQDGIQPTLITLPIMDRNYYERFGYVYHPGYKHMFCDQEMTAVGHMLGRVITLPIKFPHLHYSTGKTPKDDVNVKNDATWNQGEALFNERLKTNFGIENPVIPYLSIKWH